MTHAALALGEEGPLTFPLPREVQRVLNDFLIDRKDQVNELLEPLGFNLDRILQPEWRQLATLADIQLYGGGGLEDRDAIVALMSQINESARERREAWAPFLRGGGESAR